jgi:hypothetical protein
MFPYGSHVVPILFSWHVLIAISRVGLVESSKGREAFMRG